MAVTLPAHVRYYRDQSVTDPRPPLPGLLLEWRQTVGRQNRPLREGLVVYARGGDGHPVATETTWIRAEMLKPAYSRPEPSAGGGSG